MSERPAGIDPRGPRIAASITATLLLIVVFVALTGLSTHSPAGSDVAQRVLDPGFLLLLAIALLFLWSVVSPRTAPWAVLFRTVIRPRLRPPVELEDPRPPRFAQGVGSFVTAAGLLLHVLGVPLALPIAASLAFAAAFLNAAFGLCLGCMLYLALRRAGLMGRPRPTSA